MGESDAAVMAKTGYHHGDLKAQLVAVVRQLVEEKGPDGFSISEASRRAGVSTAAPYKHFKDKPAILKAVVTDGMERLETAMQEVIATLPVGSIERVNALGQAYIDFARAEPGVFRLVFGLTEGHEADETLMARGRDCFGIIIGAVADYLGLEPDDPKVARRAYMLWTFVHGHSFLVIDRKTAKMQVQIDEAALLSAVSAGILGDGAAAR